MARASHRLSLWDHPASVWTMALYLARNEIKARLKAKGIKLAYVDAAELSRMARALLIDEIARLELFKQAKARCAALAEGERRGKRVRELRTRKAPFHAGFRGQ